MHNSSRMRRIWFGYPYELPATLLSAEPTHDDDPSSLQADASQVRSQPRGVHPDALGKAPLPDAALESVFSSRITAWRSEQAPAYRREARYLGACSVHEE